MGTRALIFTITIGFSLVLAHGEGGPSSPELVLQKGHAGFIRDLDFSPDGKLLATGADDSSIRLWDVSTARELRQISQGAVVQRVKFSPDGHLVAGMSFQQLKIWDVSTGSQVRVFSYFDSSPVYPGGIAFTPDGKEVVAIDGSRAFMWDVGRGDSRHVEAFPYTITCFSAVPNSTVIALCQKDTVILWNIASWKAERTLGPASPFPITPEAAEELKQMATPVKPLLGEEAARVYTDTDPAFVLSIAIAPEWHRLLTTHVDGSVRAWDTESGTQAFARKVKIVDGIAANPSAPMFATSSGDHINMWDLRSGDVVGEMTPPEPQHYGTIVPVFSRTNGKIGPIRFGPDGTVLAQGKVSENRVIFWSSASRSILRLTQTTLGVTDARLSEDGRWLTTITGFIPAVWDLKGGREVDLGDFGKTDAFGVWISDDSRWTAWNVASEIRIAPLNNPSEAQFVLPGCRNQDHRRICSDETSSLAFLSFSSNNRHVFLREEMEMTFLHGAPIASFYEMDIATASVVKALAVPVQGAITSAFNPDREILAIAEFPDLASALNGAISRPKRTIRLWDWKSGEELPGLSFPIMSDEKVSQMVADTRPANPENFDDLLPVRIGQARGFRDGEQVAQIVFSSDGRKLAAAYWFHGITVWNMESREKLFQTGPRLGDGGEVHFPVKMSFTQDSRWLAVGWNNGDLSVIDTDSGKDLAKWNGHDGPVTSVAIEPDGTLLVSSGQDGTVRVWDMDRKSLQLTVVPSLGNDEWAAVAPNGLFDGGTNGWSRFIWRFGHTIFDTLPTEVYFREYFHPGLIGQVFRRACPSGSSQ